MKSIIKKLIWFGFAGLLAANIYLFMLGVKLGDEITHFDSEIKRLKTENTALETQVYQANSLSKAASMAAELSFNNKNQPIYMDNPAYAMR